MKEIKEEYTATTTWYEAEDGTRFFSESECGKYEESAICAILAKLKKSNVTFTHEDIRRSPFLNTFSEEYVNSDYIMVVPQNEGDLKELEQLRQLLRDKTNYHKEKELYFGLERLFHPILLTFIGSGGMGSSKMLKIENFEFFDLKEEVEIITKNMFTVGKTDDEDCLL